jgi:hypothetical protein
MIKITGLTHHYFIMATHIKEISPDFQIMQRIFLISKKTFEN